MAYKAEIFDLWQHLCGEIFEPLIRCGIDFEGRVDETILKQAVTASLKTIPIIGCGFGGTANRPRWVEKGFTGKDIVRVVESWQNSEDDVLKCLSSGIDFPNEPQLKIFIVRKIKDDTLCVIISHAVCDGAGFKRYLYLLGEIYTKLKNNHPIILPAFCPRGVKPLFAGIPMKEKMRILFTDYNAYSSANKTNQRGVGFQSCGSETVMKRQIISSEEFNRLKHFAKAEGVTINDCLMALFARVFCKNTDTDRILLPSTIDLRKFIPPNRAYGIGNYSSNCMCVIPVRPEDTLIDTVKRVAKQMDAHKSDKGILKSVMLWGLAARAPWFLLKWGFPKYAVQPVVSFTNLGIIDMSKLKFDNLYIKYAYLTASIKPRPYLQLTASTFNDCCTLGFNIYGSEKDKQFVCTMLGDMRKEIKEIGKQAQT